MTRDTALGSMVRGGSFAVDETGRRCLDLTMGYGSLLFGHGPAAVVTALSEQLDRDWVPGRSGAVEEWVALIQRLVPCAEDVRFTASATEASMLALRVARAATGREWIIRFTGHYHGCFDEALASGSNVTEHGFHPLAGSRVIVLDDADQQQVEDYLRTRKVAAIILEPGGGGGGLLPYQPVMLARLRELSRATGSVLIFDESISGFRYAAGGVQELAGVPADLCVLSKILTGGLPGGALAGSAGLLALVTSEIPGSDAAPVRYSSTFAGHPLTAAAGAASLRLAAPGTGQAQANAHAQAVATVLNAAALDCGCDWRTFVTSSVIHHVAGSVTAGVPAQPSRAIADLAQRNWALQRAVAQAFREHGVLLHPLHAWSSTTHDSSSREFLADVAPRALRAALLRAPGLALV
jgi:glutamate-1-semialdehyde 2,1-aminomutase